MNELEGHAAFFLEVVRKAWLLRCEKKYTEELALYVAVGKRLTSNERMEINLSIASMHMTQGRYAEAWQIYRATVNRVDAMDSRLQPRFANVKITALDMLGATCYTFAQYDLALAYYEQYWAFANDRELYAQVIAENKRIQQVTRVELQLRSTRAVWESERRSSHYCLCSACQCVVSINTSTTVVCTCGRAWYCSDECEFAFAAQHVHFSIPLDSLPKDVVRAHILPLMWTHGKPPLPGPSFWLGLRTLSRTWRAHIDGCAHIWLSIIPTNWGASFRPKVHLQSEEDQSAVAYVLCLAKKRKWLHLRAEHDEILAKLRARTKEFKKLEQQVHQLELALKSKDKKMKELE